MSGYSDTINCPRCGSLSLEQSIDRDDVSGICVECGYEYHTVTSLVTLEQINETRIAFELEPLTELKLPVKGWTD